MTAAQDRPRGDQPDVVTLTTIPACETDPVAAAQADLRAAVRTVLTSRLANRGIGRRLIARLAADLADVFDTVLVEALTYERQRTGSTS